MTRPLPHLFFLALPFFLLALSSGAQLLTFDLESPGDERVLISESIVLDGTPYVSLPLLMEQAGGAYNLLPTRVRVDYKSATAWLRVDDVLVHALSIFSLGNPIRRHEEDAAIAAADVAPFFLKAFRTTVSLREVVAEEPLPGEEEAGNLLSEPEDVAIGIPLSSVGPVEVIVIDPGHGGYDQGLEGVAGYAEKTLCLDVALRLKVILEESLTQEIVLTRSDDIGLPVSDRLMVANNSGGDLLISIHAGGMIAPRTSGVALYYKPAIKTGQSGLFARRRTPGGNIGQSSRTLAHAIASSLTNSTAAALRGVLEAPARLLRDSTMPSVMVEVGCLTNPTEEGQLQTEAYRARVAEGIAQGVLAYLAPPGRVIEAADRIEGDRLNAAFAGRN